MTGKSSRGSSTRSEANNARQVIDAAMTEAELQAEIVRTAKRFGFTKIYHTWRSDKSEKGFPDLVMLKDERQVVVECKREGEKPREEQVDWLLAFGVAGAETYVWYPHDLSSGEIDLTLAR